MKKILAKALSIMLIIATVCLDSLSVNAETISSIKQEGVLNSASNTYAPAFSMPRHSHEYNIKTTFKGGYRMECECGYYHMYITSKPKIVKTYNKRKTTMGGDKTYTVDLRISKPFCKIFDGNNVSRPHFDIQYSSNKKSWHDEVIWQKRGANYQNEYECKTFYIILPRSKKYTKFYIRMRIAGIATMNGKDPIGAHATTTENVQGPWSNIKKITVK